MQQDSLCPYSHAETEELMPLGEAGGVTADLGDEEGDGVGAGPCSTEASAEVERTNSPSETVPNFCLLTNR